MTDSPTHFSRRTALKAFGVTALGTVGVAGTGVTATSSAAQDGAAPAVEWTQSYKGGPKEYTNLSLLDVLQTEDGGYAVMGEGQPVTQTGPEQEQFAVVKTNDEGEKQWVAFANDEDEETALEPIGYLQTDDGGHVVVGDLDWVNYEFHLDEDGDVSTEGKPPGAAAKFGPGGEVEWFTTIDAGTDQAHEDGGLYAVAKSSTGDGFVAAGKWEVSEPQLEQSPWLVKFGSDGSVQWERKYDELENLDRFQYAFVRDGGGYTLSGGASSSGGSYPFSVVDVAENGDLEDSTIVDLEFSNDHYTREILLTDDGGFALAGEVRPDQEDWDMWFVKLDGDLNVQWSKTYDGPYEGSDLADIIIQTEDGGYALGGHMAEAYTGEWRPAILKTDAEGNEQWEKLLEIDSPGLDGLIQTADGGYGAVTFKTLTKLGPGGSGDGDGDGGGSDGEDGEGGETTASVTFADQDSDGSSVVVQEATLSDGGYLVIHDETGAVLGHSTFLDPGIHENVEITLDSPISADQTLIAMAHTDDGDQSYEFPDADGPYTTDGKPVTDPATIILSC